MKTFAASLLACALAGASGIACAQGAPAAHPYGDAPYGNYEHRHRQPDAYQQPARYAESGEWARVVRVDPVIVQRRGDDPHCRTRRDDYAVYDPYRRDDRRDPYGGNDPYRDPYARDPYARDPYARDPYARDPYARDPYARDPYGRDPYAGDAYGRDPYRDARRDENGRMVATVLGGIAGAVLGSKVGDGSGRYVGTAVGSMVGGMAGRGIYESSRRAREARDGYVTVCDPEPYGGGYGDGRAVNEYDVTYEYAGRQYTTRTPYHPGDRIRVRVDVRPE